MICWTQLIVFGWRCDKLRYWFGPMLPREQNYVSVKHLIGGSDLVETDNVFKCCILNT